MLDRVQSLPETTLATNEAVGKRPEQNQKKEFGFFDLLDMVNPLQHLPLIGTIYREITGDQIRPISRIIGGAVFGGPVGAASGLLTAVIADGTGQEPLELALSFVDRREDRDGEAVKHAKAAALYERSRSEAVRIRPTVSYNS